MKKTLVVLIFAVLCVDGFILIDAIATAKTTVGGCPCCCYLDDPDRNIQLKTVLAQLAPPGGDDSPNCNEVCADECGIWGVCQFLPECDPDFSPGLFLGVCYDDEKIPYCSDGNPNHTYWFYECLEGPDQEK